jgi:hypothetical protein
MRKFWINVTLSIAISIPVLVKSGSSADFQTWSEIATIYQFSDRLRYDGDQGIRGLLSQNDFKTPLWLPSSAFTGAERSFNRGKHPNFIHCTLRFGF